MSDAPGSGRGQKRRVRRVFETLVRERRAIALASASGVGVFLCFPDWDLFPLAFVTLAPLILAVRAGSARRAFALALWSGLLTNLGGFYWVTGMLQDYGYMPWSVSALLTFLLCLQQGLTWAAAVAAGRWFELRGAPGVLVYPFGLAAAESLMPLIFPWYFGNSQYLNLPLAQLSALGGVVLLSAVLSACNTLLADAIGERSGAALRRLAVGAAVLAALHGWGSWQLDRTRAAMDSVATLNVGVVQANIGIYDKHERSLLSDQLLLHQRLSAELEQAGAELIIWPETAYAPPGYVFADDTAGRAVQVGSRLDRFATWIPRSDAPLVASSDEDDLAGTGARDRLTAQRGFATPLVTGTLMWSRRTEQEMLDAPPRGDRPYPYNVHNSAILLDGDGRVLGAYDKTLRMIFSEHVPGGYLLWRLTGINLYRIIPAAGDFFAGRPTEGFVLPTERGEVRIGIMICYEDIMASFGRAIHAGRPHFIVNVTNDAWFGDTAEPRLHLALSVFRAIEQRTSLIRATNTGVSAFVSPTGRIDAQTETFAEETLLHAVPLLEATTTPFMRLGNWSPWALGASVLLALVRRRRTAAPDG